MAIKKGDRVMIMVGPDEGDKAVKGEVGKVQLVDPDKNTVVVEGLNIIKKHRKPRSAKEQGGVLKRPRAISASNVLLYCEVCKTGVRHGIIEKDDKKSRFCKKCAKTGKETILEYRESAKAEKKAASRRVTKRKAAEKEE